MIPITKISVQYASHQLEIPTRLLPSELKSVEFKDEFERHSDAHRLAMLFNVFSDALYKERDEQNGQRIIGMGSDADWRGFSQNQFEKSQPDFFALPIEIQEQLRSMASNLFGPAKIENKNYAFTPINPWGEKKFEELLVAAKNAIEFRD